MTRLTEEWISILESTVILLREMDEVDVSIRPSPGRWSKKEILGHLIDSASNNHQRFVRASQTDTRVFPNYEQDAWVAGQKYNERNWFDVVELWYAYNRHLVHVVMNLEPSTFERMCTIGDETPVPLRTIAETYVWHLKHHLAQIGVIEV